MRQERPDMDDLPHTEWECERCGAMNSCLDAICQWCEPEQDRADYERDHTRDYRKNER